MVGMARRYYSNSSFYHLVRHMFFFVCFGILSFFQSSDLNVGLNQCFTTLLALHHTPAHRLSYVPPGRSGSSSPVPAYSGSSPESRVSGLFQNHKLLFVDFILTPMTAALLEKYTRMCQYLYSYINNKTCWHQLIRHTRMVKLLLIALRTRSKYQYMPRCTLPQQKIFTGLRCPACVRDLQVQAVSELMTANTTGWTMENLSDHIDRNVDALTALGKDPRGTKISAAEMPVIGYRERIAAASRIEWDKRRFIQEQAEAMAESHGAGRNRDQETSSKSQLSNTTTQKGSLPVRDRRTATFLHASVAESCRICKGSHKASECQEVLKADHRQRKALARKTGLCFSCFEPGHYAKRCGQRGGSVKSGRKGNSPDPPSGGKPSDLPREEEQKGDSGPRSLNVNLVSFDEAGGTRLQIIRALAHGDGGEQMVVNCMFDTAAERSFIRADVARKLALRGETLSIAVHGFGGGCGKSQESQWVNFWLSPLAGGPRRPVRALTMEKLCDNNVLSGISTRAWPHLRGLGLLEEEREEELQVHVVLGIDNFFRLLGTTIVRGGEDDPVAVETCLGWVVCGPQPPPQSQTPVVPVGESSNSECDLILRKFWELEAIGIHPESEKAQSDKAREEFERSLSYDGVRYTVRLFWKKAGSILPNNYKLALKRLGSVQKKLIRDLRRLYEYSAVIPSYLDNGWAEEASEAGPVGRTWYLPHHAVYQKGSTGDVKCLVVFDVSAQFGGVSLNDLLDPGANLQTDLLGILICFRRYRIGLQADIQKMYLQVALHEADKGVCRFLWQEPGRDELPKTYRMSRSACMQRGMRRSALGNSVTSCPTWDQESNDGSRLWKTLAILWERGADVLTFCPLERVVAEIPDTKRGLLTLAASVFDPLGCLAPYTVRAKVMIQLLWQEGIAWDDPLPSELRGQRQTWKEKLPDLSRIAVNRAVVQVSVEDITRLELHGFADASGKAYGAVVYLRLTHRDEGIENHLVAAKSRVALIKCLSLPRLELMAALLCARLLAYVNRELEMNIDRCVHWSDSTITLCWFKENPQRWKPFVANRVREIQELSSPDSWRHCLTEENPTDLLSRECSLHRLSSETLWWSGPGWLLLAEASWPDIKVKRDQDRAEAEKEGRRSALLRKAASRDHALPAFHQQCAVAYGVTENDAWTDGSGDRRGRISVDSADPGGRIRVGGRLRRANLLAETKHPVLLPHGDDVVRMIIQHVHQRQLHAGVNQTLAASRQRYWITRGRSAVKNAIKQCVTCRRSVGQPFGQKMVELPAERVTPTGPFRHVGVDFAGPGEDDGNASFPRKCPQSHGSSEMLIGRCATAAQQGCLPKEWKRAADARPRLAMWIRADVKSKKAADGCHEDNEGSNFL
ncbi:hypothetical protein T11_14827 [Trichinella zimbabwensis]|uniref:CCHC-type domain-containing protein n=1 Tax=Trichinella zimbabwensis TaxID=268475 RepID=A0A0V1I384_9BILA|nr:hypothetical protein T11_14827 [Trichinella zimbabwensis]